MLYRPPIRTSRAAAWSRSFGGLAVPLIILTLIGHRQDLVSTPQAMVLIAVSFLLGVLAFLCALYGFVVVWDRGFSGARNGALGVLYAFIALLPALYGGYLALANPALSDISTDWVNPPQFIAAAPVRTGKLNSIAVPPPDKIALQKRAFPDITTRHFGIGSEQLFRAAKKVVDRENWKVLAQLVPKEDGDPGRIEAVARSPIFVTEDDVSIRVLAEPSGAAIDVRSSSRYGTHDLGENAARIRAFFVALDTSVAEGFGQ